MMLPSYTLRGRETPIEICCVPARERVVVEMDAAKPELHTVAPAP